MAFDKVIDSAKLDSALSETANAIREKSGSIELMAFDETHGFKDAVESIDTETVYNQGFEDGKNSVPQLERYADTFRLTTLNALGKSEAVLNLDNVNSLDLLCAIRNPSQEVCEGLRNITVEHLTINAPKLVNSCENMLTVSNYAVDNKMKRLTLNVDTQNSRSFANMFNNLSALEVIDGTPIDMTASVNNNGMFITKSLIEVRFKGEIKRTLSFSYSPNLSDNTIQNIIDHLADLTGGTSQTLYVHSDVLDRLTDEQYMQILNKNWSAT